MFATTLFRCQSQRSLRFGAVKQLSSISIPSNLEVKPNPDAAINKQHSTESDLIRGKNCGEGPETGDDLEELEEMFVHGPAGVEWGGPTRGGQRPEPTRYGKFCSNFLKICRISPPPHFSLAGDWERKGRASDF